MTGKQQLLPLVGDPRQIAGVVPFTLMEGKSAGVACLEVYTGSGLRFTVIPGRGMDIGKADYKGINLSFMSATGVVSSVHHEAPGLGWLRSFYGGLLETCGVTNAGSPCEDGGRSYGLHGRLGNTAAESVSISQAWDGDVYRLEVRGSVREACALEENLLLTRTIATELGAKTLILQDTVENAGFSAQPLMMLYHFNLGYPLFSPQAELAAPVGEVSGATEDFRSAALFQDPQAEHDGEQHFYRLRGGRDGNTLVALMNRTINAGNGLGVVLRFNLNELPCFTQWKMLRKGFYMLGLEPGTVIPEGRKSARAQGRLPMIGGQESRRVRLEIQIIDTSDEFDAIRAEVEGLSRGIA